MLADGRWSFELPVHVPNLKAGLQRIPQDMHAVEPYSSVAAGALGAAKRDGTHQLQVVEVQLWMALAVELPALLQNGPAW